MSEDEIPRVPGPFTTSEAADLAEIQQKIFFYGWCIDQRRFEDLDRLFTTDAVVHYDVPDGTRLSWPEMRSWLPEALAIFRLTQHNMNNPMIALSRDSARSRTYGLLIHFQELLDGEITVMRHHSVYHDQWLRQPEGWKIASRRLAHLQMEGTVHPASAVRAYRTPQPI